MSKRTSSAATNGGAPKAGQVSCMLLSSAVALSLRQRSPQNQSADIFPLAPAAYDKQKDLLSSETGHFSLIRAMHLADLITEMNGTRRPGRPRRIHRQLT